MIAHLHLKGFRLLDDADLPLDGGLVVLTGETGAGKSLLIGAVSLALGAPATETVQELSGEKALVQLVMDVPPALLEGQDLPGADQPGEVILTRELRKGGRSSCRLNGEITPQKKVAQLGEQLVDIHSQDARRLLRDETRQLLLFDAWAGGDVAKAKGLLAQTLPAWRKARETLEAFESNQAALVKELEEGRVALSDMDAAALPVDEEADLRRREQMLKSHQRLVDSLGAALTALEGDDDGAVDLLGRAARAVEDLSETVEAFSETAGRLRHLEEASSVLSGELRDRLEEATEGELDLDGIQEKLYGHERLLRRFRVDTEGLWALHAELSERVEELEGLLGDPEALKAAEKKARKDLDDTLKQLAAARQKKKAAFEKEMTTALRDLAFNQVRFTVAFDVLPGGQVKTGVGNQRVVFQVSFNPGEPPRALSAVASGGEVNRVCLGLKSVFAGKFDIPCLIFDEIDAGVGGDVARTLADKLVSMARNHQVIAITHNHWVAAKADLHLKVDKQVRGNQTVISLHPLTGKDRKDELVRMLGTGGGTGKGAEAYVKEVLAASEKRGR